MSKVTFIGAVPNTDLAWEKYEYDVWLENNKTGKATEYLLVQQIAGRRKVVANLDMGELVALRASIDDLVASEADPPWRKIECSQLP